MVCRGQREVPGQEFRDAVDGVPRDLAQYVSEVAFRVGSVELGGADPWCVCGTGERAHASIEVTWSRFKPWGGVGGMSAGG